MAHVRFSELKRSLTKHLDRVEQERLELIVRRRNRESMVIMPLAKLNAMRQFLGEPVIVRTAEHDKTET